MPNITLPPQEVDHLRRLATRQAEIAALPVMTARRKLWTEMNDATPGARPPFAIETWTFNRDFMPDDILQCKTPLGKQLEHTMLGHIRRHEIINDDTICPDTLEVWWQVWCDEFGLEITQDTANDSEGIELGYHLDHPIKDLGIDGFDMIKPAAFGVDREATLTHKNFMEDNFGDILTVELRSNTFGNNNLTQRIMRLMSMETFFMAMYDCPDKVHGLMRLLCDNAKRMAQWAESEGLLVLNNENQCTCGTCFNYTTLLPKQPIAPGQVKLTDMWAVMDSQETVGVSPELFDELIFPYYKELAELYGLVYWGCCEPADPIWEKSLQYLPHLKAISISRWANQEYMADALTGKGIIFSRKPDPNLLGVDVKLNEDAWRAEIRSTLEAVAEKDIPFEFIVRDVYTMHGNLNKARRAAEIAREEIDKLYDPLEI
jgi:hypothetical protein